MQATPGRHDRLLPAPPFFRPSARCGVARRARAAHCRYENWNGNPGPSAFLNGSASTERICDHSQIRLHGMRHAEHSGRSAARGRGRRQESRTKPAVTGTALASGSSSTGTEPAGPRKLRWLRSEWERWRCRGAPGRHHQADGRAAEEGGDRSDEQVPCSVACSR
jgi:hypothetical protein